MVKAHPVTNNFSGGFLSKEMWGRTDLKAYPNSFSYSENMIVRTVGNAYARGGTRMISPIKNQNAKSELYDFVFSNTQSYMFEIGNYYTRFYKAGGERIYVPLTNSAITNGEFVSDISGWVTTGTTGTGSSTTWDAGRAKLTMGTTGKAVLEQSVTTTSLNEIHVLRFEIVGARTNLPVTVSIGTASGGDQIEKKVFTEPGCYTLGFTPAVSPYYVGFSVTGPISRSRYIENVEILSDEPLELVTPWSQDTISNLKYAQSLDVTYWCSAGTDNEPVYSIARTSAENEYSWSSYETFFTDGPYLDERTDLTLTPSATTGVVTLTASADFFSADMVGSPLRIKHTNYSWGVILAYTSATVVSFEILGAAMVANASSAFREGAWSYARGFPNAVGFYDGRLEFAGHKDRPDRFWLSVIDKYTNFSPQEGGTIAATDAIYATPNDGKLNAINWVVQGKDSMIHGTFGSLFRVSGATNEPLSKDNIKRQRDNTFSSGVVQGIYVGNSTIYLSGSLKLPREHYYNLNEDNYNADDIILRAKEITRFYKFTHMKYQEEPDSIIWFLRSDGTLWGLTYYKSEQTYAWHQHIIAGTNAQVESIAVIPNTDSLSGYELWLIVKRTINGNTTRYIEIMQPFENQEQDDYCYSDSAYTYTGSPLTTISGYDHLIGETLAIWADGAKHSNLVVANDGTITLKKAASKVTAGLPYTMRIDTLPVAGISQLGSTAGKPIKVSHAIIYAFNIFYAEVSALNKPVQQLITQTASQPLGTKPIPSTLYYKVPIDSGWDTQGQISVRSQSPLPLNVGSITLHTIMQEY